MLVGLQFNTVSNITYCSKDSHSKMFKIPFALYMQQHYIIDFVAILSVTYIIPMHKRKIK